MIRLENLTKIFKTPNGDVVAADNINMNVAEGEICILLGPSGCGKTTTLKMINRLIAHTSGKIFINNQDTDTYDTVQLRRNIGYVIQQIGLFPNMTIEENICVVPKLLGWDSKRSKDRAAELLSLVALDPAQFLQRYPRELSGGQQQRIGVIRALAADPPVMLMDEPFGAIDPINREVIQDEFLKIQQTFRKTVMFVSHDIDEAVKMGDKVAIFRAGRLEQFATPDDILAHPGSEFIADFVGSDRTLKRLRLVKVAQATDAHAPFIVRGDTLDKALGLMRERNMEVVVLDDMRRPVGFVPMEARGASNGSLAEHVRPIAIHVNADSDLRTAVSEMFAHARTWLPVVDAEGRFSGCITQTGITHLLGETYRDAAMREGG
ncbi:MAG: ABC transporter ATP-binding protein [Rhodomicrobiaceae bacterium]